MEGSKETDINLRNILSSPLKNTPAVPVPDWNSPASVPPIPQTINLTAKSNPNQIIVTIPGIVSGEPHVYITLQNCVATVDLHNTLNLPLINDRTRNCEYNPARFHGVVMRIMEPRTTALIFKSGKIVCTGAKNEYDALLASKKFARIIQKLGFQIKFANFKIQNFIATCDLRFPIKLESLYQQHSQFSSYEPEIFPGLIYRMLKPKLALLIFVNGKIVFTGGKSRDEIKEALENIFPILRSYKKT